MTEYRRSDVAGGTYFFTVALANRQSSLLVDRIVELGKAFRYAKEKHPFTVIAVVVLPEHLHAIWQLPPDDGDFATRWRLIKTQFSRSIASGEARSASRIAKGERGIWQRRYWEHTIRDDIDLERHADYVHFNPVKHGHVERVADWPHSSFHRFVKAGILAASWGGTGAPESEGFGEVLTLPESRPASAP